MTSIRDMDWIPDRDGVHPFDFKHKCQASWRTPEQYSFWFEVVDVTCIRYPNEEKWDVTAIRSVDREILENREIRTEDVGEFLTQMRNIRK